MKLLPAQPGVSILFGRQPIFICDSSGGSRRRETEQCGLGIKDLPDCAAVVGGRDIDGGVVRRRQLIQRERLTAVVLADEVLRVAC